MGLRLGVGSQIKFQNKKETSQKVAVVNVWRKISESIPWVDMKQSQTLSPRKKKKKHY